jgi:hypothetical protein
MRTGRRGLLVLVISLCVAGCSSTTAAAPASPLGMPKASIVADLPVPSEALLVVNKPNQLGEYRLPNGVSLVALNDWFDQQLPQSGWKQWVRCRLSHSHGSAAGKIWSWRKDGSFLDLFTISIPGTKSIPGQVRFTERLQKLFPLVCT